MHLDLPLIGILRGIEGGFFREVMHASYSAGLQALEITMNTDGAADILESCRAEVPPGKLLGMGTVRNMEEAKLAIDSGAMFLVSPNTDTGVIEYAGARDIPVIAGAFTPTEVYGAWMAGAGMVKVFPCGVVGPAYIKELRGPFDRIPLVAVGGVTIKNLRDYFMAGASGVGVGTTLFGREALAGKDLGALTKNVGSFIETLKGAIS